MKFHPLLLLTAGFLASCGNDTEQPTPAPKVESTPVSVAFTLPATAERTVAVAFLNQSQNATRYVWTFGDGSTTQDQNPTHAYAAAGVYAVKLKAYGADKNDSITKSITILPYDLQAHTPVRFAGVYSCKVVSIVTDPAGKTTKTRLNDQDITITQQATNVLSWSPYTLTYVPANPGAPQLPDGNKYNFDFPQGQNSPNFGAYSSFFTSGDSARFSSTERIGHGYVSREYHGIRRP